MNQPAFIFAFLRHYFASRSGFSLHSPFIFRFYSEILRDKTIRPSCEKTGHLRKRLVRDRRYVSRTDYGARTESSPGLCELIRIGTLAKKSSMGPKKGRLLYKLTRDLHPGNILELGTCLGISTLYMAEAAPEAKVMTIEGCPETLNLAARNFEEAGNKNISALSGTFEELLPKTLESLGKLDLMFIDGNHRETSTLGYYRLAKPYFHSDSVLILDDIHWSSGMETAWKKIISDPEVRVSIDLFDLGIIYFKKELSKEDFVLRY